MAHKTLVNGTAYEISGGKTLVDATEYNIKNGKTLVDGTEYSIEFVCYFRMEGYDHDFIFSKGSRWTEFIQSSENNDANYKFYVQHLSLTVVVEYDGKLYDLTYDGGYILTSRDYIEPGKTYKLGRETEWEETPY